jgi:membrane protease YdiL (CAAX protease family)
MATSLASNENRVRRLSSFTWLGLAIALFGLLVVRHAVLYFSPTLTVSAAIWSESLMWVCIVAVCLIIRRGEKLPFSSVGLGTTRWSKSLRWGLVLTVGIIVIGSIPDVIAVLTHFQPNEFARQLTRLPFWLLTLTCVRAGVGEELFYRGYAIERLQALGLSRFWAAAVPILIFSVGHWTTGWQNVVTAFIIGSVLAAFYLWRRDLLANMIAHFLVDFIGVAVPRLFS